MSVNLQQNKNLNSCDKLATTKKSTLDIKSNNKVILIKLGIKCDKKMLQIEGWGVLVSYYTCIPQCPVLPPDVFA